MRLGWLRLGVRLSEAGLSWAAENQSLVQIQIKQRYFHYSLFKQRYFHYSLQRQVKSYEDSRHGGRTAKTLELST